MTWVLTIILILDGQAYSYPVGLLIDEAACMLAGAGIAQGISIAEPHSVVQWRCDLQEGVMS